MIKISIDYFKCRETNEWVWQWSVYRWSVYKVDMSLYVNKTMSLRLRSRKQRLKRTVKKEIKFFMTQVPGIYTINEFMKHKKKYKTYTKRIKR